MAKFKGVHDETFTADASLEDAKAHFGDLEMIASSYPEIESSEKLDEKTMRFRIKPKNALNVTFAGRYDCKYEFKEKDVLSWETVGTDANIMTQGRMRFSVLGDSRTRIHFHEEMECDIPINRLLAKALTPIVQHNIASGCKEYLKRIRGKL